MDEVQERYLDYVLKTDLFKGLSRRDAAQLIRILEGEIIRYEKDVKVAEYKETVRSKSIFLILSGMVHLVRYGLKGERYIIDYFAQGNIAGYVASISKRYLYSSSLVSARDTTVLKLCIPESKDVPHEMRDILARNLLEIISDKYARLMQKGDITTRRFVRDKVLTYLSYESQLKGTNQFEIPLNRQELADYICVDRTTLSTVLTKMKKNGLIFLQVSHPHTSQDILLNV